MEIQIIQVPYDSGHRDIGMGDGPARLIEHNPLTETHIDKIEVQELSFELGTTFRVLRSLSEKVSSAREHNRFPLVLAGNCISSVGTVAGLGPDPPAIVWLDAHADFNTPETTVSGFVDGMALATATGRCWRSLTSSIPGFQPAVEGKVVLIGARDVDPEERRLLQNSRVRWIDEATIRKLGVRGALAGALRKLKADRIYLHIDLDVLDIREAHVNQFSSADGLTREELLEIVRTVAEARPIAAAAITAYDPSFDTDGRALQAGAALMRELCGSTTANGLELMLAHHNQGQPRDI